MTVLRHSIKGFAIRFNEFFIDYLHVLNWTKIYKQSEQSFKLKYREGADMHHFVHEEILFIGWKEEVLPQLQKWGVSRMSRKRQSFRRYLIARGGFYFINTKSAVKWLNITGKRNLMKTTIKTQLSGTRFASNILSNVIRKSQCGKKLWMEITFRKRIHHRFGWSKQRQFEVDMNHIKSKSIMNYNGWDKPKHRWFLYNVHLEANWCENVEDGMVNIITLQDTVLNWINRHR